MADDAYIAGLKKAIEVITELPPPEVAPGDLPWEQGVTDGREEVLTALRKLLDPRYEPYEP